MRNVKQQVTYSKEYKGSLVKRMLPPENISPKELAKESGVSITSLKVWLRKAQRETKKEQIKWIPIDVIKENEEKIITKESEPIKVKIGSATIDVEVGFNKELLLEVMRLVAKI